MRNILKNKLTIVLILFIGVLSSCDDQEVAPIANPDDFSVSTITQVTPAGPVKEGDVLHFRITLSKMIKDPVFFATTLSDASVASGLDIEVMGGNMPAFALTSDIYVTILEDRLPEESEPLEFVISSSEDLTWNFQLSPASEDFTFSGTVEDTNDLDFVTVGLWWADDHDDWDLIVFDDAGGYDASGATGADPEIDQFISKDSPDGVYSVGVDPYDVANTVTDFHLGVAAPDGSVSTATVTVDLDLIDTYPTTFFGLIEIATITKSGDSITLTTAF